MKKLNEFLKEGRNDDMIKADIEFAISTFQLTYGDLRSGRDVAQWIDDAYGNDLADGPNWKHHEVQAVLRKNGAHFQKVINNKFKYYK